MNLADLEMKGFGQAAIFIMNSAGFESRPMKLLRSDTTPTTCAQATWRYPFSTPIPRFRRTSTMISRSMNTISAVLILLKLSYSGDNSVLGKNVRWLGSLNSSLAASRTATHY